jgi:hypothetical protein
MGTQLFDFDKSCVRSCVPLLRLFAFFHVRCRSASSAAVSDGICGWVWAGVGYFSPIRVETNR